MLFDEIVFSYHFRKVRFLCIFQLICGSKEIADKLEKPHIFIHDRKYMSKNINICI